MADPSQFGEMLQRIMTRLDYLEFNALNATKGDVVNVHERVDISRADLADLQWTVERMKREKTPRGPTVTSLSPATSGHSSGPRRPPLFNAGCRPTTGPRAGNARSLEPICHWVWLQRRSPSG